MAAKQFPLSVVINAVDNISKPLRVINQRLNDTFKPVRRLQAGFSAMAGASGLTGARNAANGFYQSIQRTSQEVGNLAGTMMRLNILAVSTGYLFNRGFIGNADFFERMNISLKAIEGSADKAAESMEFLKKMTVDTPFGIEELSKAYRVMKGFGLDPQKNDTMQSVVDQVAKLGGRADDITGIAMQLGQAFSKNRLQAQDANILVERGVPVWGLLQRAVKRLNPEMEVTVARLREMSENGELGADAIKQLIKQMGIESKGASLAMMKTWSGMVSQIKDQWMFFTDELMNTGPFQFLKDQLRGILDEIDRMKASGELRALAEDWGAKLLSGLRQLREAAVGFWEVAQQIYGVVKVIKDALGGWDNLIYLIAGLMVANLVVAIAASVQAFLALAGAVALAGIKMLMLVAANPVLAALGILIAGIAAGAYLVYQNWDSIKASLVGIWTWIADGIRNAWGDLWNWIDAKIDALVGKFRAMGDSIRNVLSYIPGFGSTDASLSSSSGFGPSAPIAGGGLPGAGAPGRAEVNVNFSNVPSGTTIRPGRNSNVPLNLDVGRMMVAP